MAPKRHKVDPDMAEVIRGLIQAQSAMMTNQNAQAETLRLGLESTVAAIDRVVAPRPRRDGTAEDFRKMGPCIFRGTEGPLVAEAWLDEVEDLLVAARVPLEHYVDVAML